MGFTSGRKYERYTKFADIIELISWLDGGGWCYIRDYDRPLHPSFIMSQQLHTLLLMLRSGCICRAKQRNQS